MPPLLCSVDSQSSCDNVHLRGWEVVPERSRGSGQGQLVPSLFLCSDHQHVFQLKQAFNLGLLSKMKPHSFVPVVLVMWPCREWYRCHQEVCASYSEVILLLAMYISLAFSGLQSYILQEDRVPRVRKSWVMFKGIFLLFIYAFAHACTYMCDVCACLHEQRPE